MFRFTRKAKTAQNPVHPLNQFATVLTADQLAQYRAGKALLAAAHAERTARLDDYDRL
jgi:hypothetical protein